MGATVPLWVIVLQIILAPVLGLVGVAVGAKLGERSKKRQEALRKLEELFVDVNTRLVTMRQTLERWQGGTEERPGRLDASESLRMQFSAQIYAPKAHGYLVEAVSILNEAFHDPRERRAALESAIEEMRRASDEIVGQARSKG